MCSELELALRIMGVRTAELDIGTESDCRTQASEDQSFRYLCIPAHADCQLLLVLQARPELKAMKSNNAAHGVALLNLRPRVESLNLARV